jgi:phosphatidate cytidylyltransferase
MILVFILLLKADKFFMILLVFLIKTFVYKEVINVVKYNEEKKYYLFKYLIWYFMIISDFYLIGGSLYKIYSNRFPDYLIDNHEFVSFNLYVIGLILFVVYLKKGHLKAQFSQFAIAHVAIFIVCTTANLVVLNISKGKFFFVFPALLVISNDIFAYIVGKMFGRTRLIEVSPKKTLEGFIGGCIFTIISGIVLCHLKLKSDVFDDGHNDGLSKDVLLPLIGTSFKALYLHAIPFILFASFIAPFGGFFASGFKRAFKIKDFGGSIPGHGGMADRMDCQFIMGVFTYVYVNTFILKKAVGIGKVLKYVCKNLNEDEIRQLIVMLGERVGTSQQ